MNSRDKQIVTRILEETSVIMELVSGFSFDTFSGDERTKRAVCMTLINIGELVKALTDEVKAANPQIPWRAISGLRDITAHRYQTLRMEDIWHTANADIPALKNKVEMLARQA
jgi:uncharacterized protein with HEPN domain